MLGTIDLGAFSTVHERDCARALTLVGRGQAHSRAEIGHWEEYDYVIINDDLNAAFEAVQSIVRAERLKRTRRHGMGGFVQQLLEEEPDLK